MYKRTAITLPDILLTQMEKERKQVHLSRSGFIRKAIESFLGLNTRIDKSLLKKYGAIYDTLNKENKNLSNEMFDNTIDTFPKD